MSDPDVFLLERHMVPFEEGLAKAPDWMAKEARETSQERISTGLAYTKETGWVMLICGQGPFVAHRELPGYHEECEECRDTPQFTV